MDVCGSELSTIGGKMIKIQEGEVGRMLALLEEETIKALIKVSIKPK